MQGLELDLQAGDARGHNDGVLLDNVRENYCRMFPSTALASPPEGTRAWRRRPRHPALRMRCAYGSFGSFSQIARPSSSIRCAIDNNLGVMCCMRLENYDVALGELVSQGHPSSSRDAMAHNVLRHTFG